MEEVFIPEFVKSFRWLSLCLLALIGGSALAIAAFRNRAFPARPAAQLVGMLLAFSGLAGSGLIGWDIARTPTLVVAEDYMLIGNRKVMASEIKAAYIKSVTETNRVNQANMLDLGIIEFTHDSPLLLSKDHYDVKAVITAVRQLVEE